MQGPQFQPVKLLGINFDLNPRDIAPESWGPGLNVRTRSGGIERIGGYREWLDLTGKQVYYLQATPTDLVAYWVICADDGVWVTDGNTLNDITPPTYTTPDGDWTGGVFNGIPFFNNGVDPPFFWDNQPGNACQPLPGWFANTSCRALRAHQFHLIAMGITENGNELYDQVRWSDGADPGTLPQHWTPAPDNEAGDVILAASSGPVVDGAKLRDAFIVYKRNSTYILEYIGGTFVFEMRPLFTNSGIQATGCAVEVDGLHYVMTDTDVIQHDGQSMESLATWKIRDFLMRNINPLEARRCHVVSREADDEIWVIYPQIEEADTISAAFLYNRLTGDWGLRGFTDRNIHHIAAGPVGDGPPGDWDSQTTTWDTSFRIWNEAQYSESVPVLLMGGTDNVWQIDAATDDDGQPVDAYIERTGFPLRETSRSLTTALWPHIEGVAGTELSITVGSSPYPDDPVMARAPHRYLAFRVESSGGSPWKLHSMKIESTPQGLY
jgi:hypothetical protein